MSERCIADALEEALSNFQWRKNAVELAYKNLLESFSWDVFCGDDSIKCMYNYLCDVLYDKNELTHIE